MSKDPCIVLESQRLRLGGRTLKYSLPRFGTGTGVGSPKPGRRVIGMMASMGFTLGSTRCKASCDQAGNGSAVRYYALQPDIEQQGWHTCNHKWQHNPQATRRQQIMHISIITPDVACVVPPSAHCQAPAAPALPHHPTIPARHAAIRALIKYYNVFEQKGMS